VTLPKLTVPALGIALLLSAAPLAQQQRSSAPMSLTPDAGVKFADQLMELGRYKDAINTYRRAREGADNEPLGVRAGIGAVKGILRIAGFSAAIDESRALLRLAPNNPTAISLLGDAYWASGLFTEAEAEYARALAIDPKNARSLHGRGRSRAAQRQLDSALADVLSAVESEPEDEGYRYTLADIYEQRGQVPQAIAALEQYLDLMPEGRKSNAARWALTQLDVLKRFGSRPTEIDGGDEVFTVPFKVERNKMFVTGRVNNGRPMDFVVDTGADQTSLSPEVARDARVEPVNTMQIAGVGQKGVGFRDLQLGRINQLEIGSLKVKNVTCLIKSPVMAGMPSRESDGFAPLALGLSVSIDYEKKLLTMARRLPAEIYDINLPMRMQRLPMVRAMVNRTMPASFVVDTGGDAGLFVSRSLASTLQIDPDLRKIPVNLFGHAGQDKGAFVLAFVDVEFAKGADAKNTSVVVLNLDAPSWLIGVNIGGIMGHQFLSKYKVAIDLNRSELGLRTIQ
jgi:Flp pilus assembly protein TadD/predicted aspartyl protease